MAAASPDTRAGREHAVRAAAFAAWDRTALVDPAVAAQLGAGRYGTVVACAPGWPGCAAKRLVARSWRSRRQAYREHVVGLLQSLLLLRRVTPHFPWHYGAEVFAVPPAQLGVVLFMERYPQALVEAAPALLATPAAWVALLFQLGHAAVALATLFGVVQNDAYPRNALVRPGPPTRTVYEVGGRRYAVHAAFLAVLTDYGIASGELLAAPQVPEVAYGNGRLQGAPAVRGRYAFVQPEAHVLAYRDLPIFARDLGTLLKWPTTGDRLPPAPWAVRLWAVAALHRLDLAAAALDAPAGLLAVFHEIFAPAFLRGYGLAAAVAPCTAPPDFVLDLGLRAELLASAREALVRVQALEAEERADGPPPLEAASPA